MGKPSIMPAIAKFDIQVGIITAKFFVFLTVVKKKI